MKIVFRLKLQNLWKRKDLKNGESRIENPIISAPHPLHRLAIRFTDAEDCFCIQKRIYMPTSSQLKTDKILWYVTFFNLYIFVFIFSIAIYL